MILYNVTCNVENSIREDWMDWMKNIHIPEVMETGLFTDNKFYHILIEEQNDTTTFSVQYFAKSLNDIDNYLQNHAPDLQKKHMDRYDSRAVAFRTVMQEIL